MELALYVTITVVAFTAALGVVGYLIDRGASRHETLEGDVTRHDTRGARQ